jgi:SAM-dependent methyltransferase
VLAYYSVAADREFWSEHWGGHTPEQLLAIARTSPLTDLIVAALPKTGVVLEAGCGLGQYVLLLRERGWRAVGVDWSTDALTAARRVSPVPLATMGLTALALRTGALAAYVSLGVVEHDPAGPDAILAEAHRVLAPGGTLVISVPYVNGVRRLGAGWIRRQNRMLAAAGGKFYQYAFTRAELLGALGRHGFTPLAAHPYDPARILRKLRPRPGGAGAAVGGRVVAFERAASAVGGAAEPGGGAAAAGEGPATRGARGRLARVVRRALYTEPALRLLGHMLLVVARRE